MNCWLEAEHVGLVEEQGGAERRAEVAEEDEAGHDPDLALAEGLPDRRQRLAAGPRAPAGRALRGRSHAVIARESRGKLAARRNVASSARRSARYPPTSPTRTDATWMAPHCTDWNAPVSPRGLPLSTMRASTSTSVKARPRPITVNRPASHRRCAGTPRPSARPAAAASRRGEEEVALALAPPQRDEVGDEAVDGLDEPGDRADEEEVGDLSPADSPRSLSTMVRVWFGRYHMPCAK